MSPPMRHADGSNAACPMSARVSRSIALMETEAPTPMFSPLMTPPATLKRSVSSVAEIFTFPPLTFAPLSMNARVSSLWSM